MRASVLLVLGLAAAVAALALFLWLADFVEDKAAVPFDASIRGWVHAHSSPTLTSFMRLISLIGSPASRFGVQQFATAGSPLQVGMKRCSRVPREALQAFLPPKPDRTLTTTMANSRSLIAG